MLKEVGNSSGYEVLRYLTGVKQKTGGGRIRFLSVCDGMH